MRHNLALVAAVLALAVCVSGQVPQASKPFLDTQIAMNVRAPATGVPSSCDEEPLCSMLVFCAWCTGFCRICWENLHFAFCRVRACLHM